MKTLSKNPVKIKEKNVLAVYSTNKKLRKVYQINSILCLDDASNLKKQIKVLLKVKITLHK